MIRRQAHNDRGSDHYDRILFSESFLSLKHNQEQFDPKGVKRGEASGKRACGFFSANDVVRGPRDGVPSAVHV